MAATINPQVGDFFVLPKGKRSYTIIVIQVIYGGRRQARVSEGNMNRVIMHIDMNSYFASVAQQDNPAWRGKPVGVCEHLGGIIIAASVEAKKWGIKTGTPVWEARKLYPKIILTKTEPDRYRFYTKRFLQVFGDYTDRVEKYSIDEAFIDVTKACYIQKKNIQGEWEMTDPFEEAILIAKEIKRRMRKEVGDYLRCSVGVGTNKLIAKIGSDMQKPDGLTVVRPADRHLLYEKLKLTDIPGIGVRQERNLNALGIKTLVQLRDYPKSQLIAHFGIPGHHLYNMGQLEGSWKEGFDDEEAIKSMGHMYTVASEYRKPGILIPVLYKLSEMVGARLRVNRLAGNTIHTFMRTADDRSFGRSARMGNYLSDGREIFLECRNILQSLSVVSLEKISATFIGVTVAGLTEDMHQKSLFPADQKKQNIAPALDKINEKYGDFTAARVPAWLARDVIRDSVGFGRMKEFKNVGNFKRGK